MVKFKGTEKDKGTGEGDRRCWPEGQGVRASCASPRVQASVAQEVAVSSVSAVWLCLVAALWDWVHGHTPPVLSPQWSLPAALRAVFKIKHSRKKKKKQQRDRAGLRGL